jgi:plastocyanin
MPTRHIVIVDHMAFVPAALTIALGDCVQWEFRQAGHSVVSDSASGPGIQFDSGVKPVGGTFDQEFLAPGDWPYHCGSMPEMKGTITVAAP